MKFLTFLQESDGTYSFGRCAALFTVATGLWGFVYVVAHSHQLPDAVTLGGLAAWMTAPFVASKGLVAFARPTNADKL